MTDQERSALSGHPLILFDGLCGMCNGVVRLLMQLDREKNILYAPLESTLGQEIMTGVDATPAMKVSMPWHSDGMVLIEYALTPRQLISSRSDAAVRVLSMLGPGGRVTSAVLSWLPRRIREWAYGLIARFRYKLFGRYAICPIPNAQERARMLGTAEDGSH